MKARLIRFGVYVAIAAAIAGLTKAGTMLDLLGLSASTTAYTTIMILAAIDVLKAVEKKLS